MDDVTLEEVMTKIEEMQSQLTVMGNALTALASAPPPAPAPVAAAAPVAGGVRFDNLGVLDVITETVNYMPKDGGAQKSFDKTQVVFTDGNKVDIKGDVFKKYFTDLRGKIAPHTQGMNPKGYPYVLAVG